MSHYFVIWEKAEIQGPLCLWRQFSAFVICWSSIDQMSSSAAEADFLTQRHTWHRGIKPNLLLEDNLDHWPAVSCELGASVFDSVAPVDIRMTFMKDGC